MSRATPFEASIERIHSYARHQAMVEVRRTIGEAFYRGQTVCLMIGWGCGVLDEKLPGLTIDEERLTQRQRRILNYLDSDFAVCFGLGNEKIKGKAQRPPKRKRKEPMCL